MEYLQNPFMAYAEIPPYRARLPYTDEEFSTTYWADFRICRGDTAAIKDTFKRCQPLAKDDAQYGAELSLALNELSWAYAETHPETARLFSDLWYEWHDWCVCHYKDKDLEYYLHIVD